MSTRPAGAVRSGVALGLVLLTSFGLAGRGIGASGAFANVATAIVPADTAWSPALADRMPTSGAPWSEWIVLEVTGVLVGGFLSAWLAGRWRRPAPGGVAEGRLLHTLLGGALMGVGARLAYGCTSGLALSGGALLATGAWLFIPVAFATAMLVTRLARSGTAA
jgi:uncharacterized membrane protein YedE/YeeE